MRISDATRRSPLTPWTSTSVISVPPVTRAITVPSTMPSIPSAGTGPQPNTSSVDAATFSSATTAKISIGVRMLPLPRSAAAPM